MCTASNTRVRTRPKPAQHSSTPLVQSGATEPCVQSGLAVRRRHTQYERSRRFRSHACYTRWRSGTSQHQTCSDSALLIWKARPASALYTWLAPSIEHTRPQAAQRKTPSAYTSSQRSLVAAIRFIRSCMYRRASSGAASQPVHLRAGALCLCGDCAMATPTTGCAATVSTVSSKANSAR